MREPVLNAENLFDENYLHFYRGVVDARSDAETELIRRLLDLPADVDVLDLACGHGRIANRLAGLGCRVTGLDRTPLFLDRARADAQERGVEVDYVHGDMRDLPWSNRFDVVINWFTSFGYFPDNDGRRVLGEVFRALRPGGRFVLELNNSFDLLRRYRDSHVLEVDGDLLVDRYELDPLTNHSLVERTVIRAGRVRTVSYYVRLFTFPEIRDWLLDAGFSTVDGYDENGDMLSATSNRMLVVATR